MNSKIDLQFKLIISTLIIFFGFNNLSALAQQRKPTAAEIQQAKTSLSQQVQSLQKNNSFYSLRDHRTSEQKQNRNKLVDAWKSVQPEVAPFLGSWLGYETVWMIYPSNTKGKVCIVRAEQGYINLYFGQIADNKLYIKSDPKTVANHNNGIDRSYVFYQEGNYLGVGQIENNQFRQVNDVPLNSPTAPQEPQFLYDMDLNQLSSASLIAETFKQGGCTVSVPDRNNLLAKKIIENLPDGNYLYGELPYEGIMGTYYWTFSKAGNVITGKRYMSHTDDTTCFQGTAKDDKVLNATSIYTIIGVPERQEIEQNLSFDFNNLHPIEKPPEDLQNTIDECSGKIFTYIPQKQFATVSSHHKEASPDIEIPNYVEYGEYKFVKSKSGFYILQQKKDNKCLWVNQRGKLAAFPCEFHNFQKWNLIPISIKDNNQALYAVNVRGTFQCLAKDGSITSCNNWKMLLFSFFDI